LNNWLKAVLLGIFPHPPTPNKKSPKDKFKSKKLDGKKKGCMSRKGAENVSIYYYKTNYPNYWKISPIFPISKNWDGIYIYIYIKKLKLKIGKI
jgi:hypothetical protein